ncbi:MAG: carboxypeptidase-like regulatory domain-containing protein, partial [Desulfobulbaceae bacterium]|nr:carboxypeptidase-like regulatory domain-containing protein [Desulfobulbaceae bacterium]
IYLDKLGTNEIQHIRVASEELSDKFLVPKTPSLSISARQGQLHYLPFVLTDTGEINGVIEYREDGAELLPLANVRLQILNEAGIVFQETTSLSDGYYSFDKVFAGHWTIRLHPKQIDSLKALSMSAKTIQLTKQQNILSNVNLLIENKILK